MSNLVLQPLIIITCRFVSALYFNSDEPAPVLCLNFFSSSFPEDLFLSSSLAVFPNVLLFNLSLIFFSLFPYIVQCFRPVCLILYFLSLSSVTIFLSLLRSFVWEIYIFQYHNNSLLKHPAKGHTMHHALDLCRVENCRGQISGKQFGVSSS